MRRKEGEKQKGSVIVDRRTKGAREAQLRSEKAKAKREAEKKKKAFAEKYPKLDSDDYTDGAQVKEVIKQASEAMYGETAANAAGAGSGVDMAPNTRNKKKDKFKVVKRPNY